MATSNEKLDNKANSLLEDLKKNFGGLFDEYKKKKAEFKDSPNKLGEFLNSGEWRSKFNTSTKSDKQWCEFFNFVKSVYVRMRYDSDTSKASKAKRCLEYIDSFCHLEEFQKQYEKVFSEWSKLDWQSKENKAGHSATNLDDSWSELKEQILATEIKDVVVRSEELPVSVICLEELASENPNFDTMLGFCDKVKKLLDIDLTKYLLRDFGSFVEQFKEVFLEFKKAGCMKLNNLPKKSKDNKNNKKNEVKDADYWKNKINGVKYNVKKVEVRELTDDEWRGFLWDNRMNFTREQVRQLGFISDQDGHTDRFTLHRLEDFVYFVPKSGCDYNWVCDLRFFSFYTTTTTYSYQKEKIDRLFRFNLDTNVNKNLCIKDGTPVKYLFGHDVELLMRDISKLKSDKKFDDYYYRKLVESTCDKLVQYLCVIDSKKLMNTVLSEDGYVPNSAKDAYEKICSKEKFSNMFGCYTDRSDEYCDYKYLWKNLYNKIKSIIEIQDKHERKEAISKLSKKIFNFSKRNRESYLKQNKSGENIDTEYEANRYALWSFYKIIIKITNRAKEEKEKAQKTEKQKKENNQHNELEKVISKFQAEWLAKFNSVLKIKDDEEISNKKLKEFMEFIYLFHKNKFFSINLTDLNLIQDFAKQISDDGEFEKDAVPSVDLIKAFLNDVFDVSATYSKISKADLLETWKFDCAYKIINKLPKEWLNNRDNLISLLGYCKHYGTEKLLDDDNKFSYDFYRLNTGFGFFGFSKKQKKSILDKIGEIRDECVFYAFISECILDKGDGTEEVDVETLQLIMEKTEIYGLGLEHSGNDNRTIDNKIYDRMKEIVKLINGSNLKKKKKKQVFQSISDLYFNKLYYSNVYSCDGKLFDVELDKQVYESPKDKPTKADIICKAMEENKIDENRFCEFLKNSITQACNDKISESPYNVKKALYADAKDIVVILLDPDKFEFCKKKYKELEPNGTAFDSFDTVENAIKALDNWLFWLYWERYHKCNIKYFKAVKKKVLAGEDLNIDEDRRGIIESIKTQVVKRGLCDFSLWKKKLKCTLNCKPVCYFYLFDKETQKNLIKRACADILEHASESEDEICLDDENGDFSKLLSLAKQSGNLSVFLENDLAIKLFDKMHDQFNDFEFEFYQEMISIDKEGKLLQYILTNKRIFSDEKSEDKRLPIYRFLISDNRQDIKELDEQADDAYDKYSEAYDDWEQKNDELEEQEQEEDKKTKNIEQMKSEVDEANKKKEELYEAYKVINNKLKAMKRTLTEDDKNKLNTIAKDLLTNIRENKGKNDKQFCNSRSALCFLLSNLLGKITVTYKSKKGENVEHDFFDIVYVYYKKLEAIEFFRFHVLALCAIEKIETEFDKTVIRDSFIEFIDLCVNCLLDEILILKLKEKKIKDKTVEQLGDILMQLITICTPKGQEPYNGLSQNQFDTVIKIFVNIFEEIRSEGIKVAELLIKNTQLQKLIEDKDCKLDAVFVDRIKKLLDKNLEKEIENKDKDNEKQNQDVKKDKDGNSTEAIEKLETEQENADKDKIEIENTNESDNFVCNKTQVSNHIDNAQENQDIKNDTDKKGENDNAQFQDSKNDDKDNGNKARSNFSRKTQQYFEKINIIKKKMNQRKKSNDADLQDEKNDDSGSGSSDYEKKDVINDENKTPQYTNINNTNINTGNTNINSETQPRRPIGIDMQKTIITNSNIVLINTKISGDEQNKATETETADNSNTSQGMGYTAPAGSTAVSTALWLIFILVKAEILLIVAIIFTMISVILWGKKIYTDKPKKDEPLTDLSEQYQEESTINNNLLQRYQNMNNDRNTINQRQLKHNERNEAEPE